MYIKGGQAKTALVVGAEIFSRMLDWNDRTTCVLFGDGAGAVVLRASDKPGIVAAKLHSDGVHRDLLKADPKVSMDGKAVFKFAVTSLSEVVEEVLEAQKMTGADIDWLVPHQANIRIIEATGKKLGLGMDKVVTTVAHHGNTSAASIPLALDIAVRDGRIKAGQNVLIEAIGGGFTWGAVLIKW
jgi:3-oxoacyl-[acyl-carrier-protein] synthase-3